MITTRTLIHGAKSDIVLKQFCLILCAISLFGGPTFAQSTPTPTPSPTPYECIGICVQEVCTQFAPPNNGTGNCVSLSEPCVKCSCDSSGTDQLLCESISIMRYVSSAGVCLPDLFDNFACHLTTQSPSLSPSPTPSPIETSSPSPYPSPSPMKLTASDSATSDWFGYSVGMDSATSIIGAPYDDDRAGNSGSAYIFDTSTRAQLFKLTASDGALSDQFGWSVGVSGATAIVGAYWDDDRGTNSGSAYIFDTSTGAQLFKLTASDGAASDNFGWSVGVSGATAIVGVPYDDDQATSSGSAFIFDTSTGAQIFKLTASDGGYDSTFGYSVGVSGVTAIVGAYKHMHRDDNHSGKSGSAYIFDTSTGAQLFKLTASDGNLYDYFGNSVAVNGATVVVGAYYDDDRGTESGSAYIFDKSTGAQLFKLTASDGAFNSQFGYSVAVSGDTAIIGAKYDGERGYNSGSAYLFDTSTGAQLFKITAPDGASGDFFGHSVAVSGANAIVGVYIDNSHSGSAYIFHPVPT